MQLLDSFKLLGSPTGLDELSHTLQGRVGSRWSGMYPGAMELIPYWGQPTPEVVAMLRGGQPYRHLVSWNMAEERLLIYTEMDGIGFFTVTAFSEINNAARRLN